MNSNLISKNLLKWADKWSNDVVIPNFYVDYWEMDMFKMTWSWYILEYEIKISRWDFFNDFKKWNKHELLKEWKLSCNRFFFVVPKDLIKIDEIPEYAWLLYFEECWTAKFPRFTLIKNAKVLHKRKKTEDNKFLIYLLNKMAFRDTLSKGKIYNLKQKNYLLEHDLKRKQKDLDDFVNTMSWADRRTTWN